MADEKEQPTTRSTPFAAADEQKQKSSARSSAQGEVASDEDIDADERENSDIS
ncbi:hypothetical protein [Streptomyces sp. NPDC059063]|uniref:hypothetical protein n=1 Tax=unclassified Streptomyces TaxID=2593676 RepID=UPI00367A5ECE